MRTAPRSYSTGSIWDEANEKALELVEQRGLTYIHPFDDLDLITGQGTLGLEIYDDLPSVETVSSDRRRRPDLRRLDGTQGAQPEDPRHWRGVVGSAGDEAERRGR